MKIIKVTMIFLVLLAAAQSVIIVQNKIAMKRNNIRIEKLGGEINALLAENNNLRNLVKIKEKKSEIVSPETEELLKNNLVNNPQIIKFSGVKGGTMNFYDKERIRVINSKWVCASFDDGHINGEMILEYTINKDKSVNWKEVASFIE